MSGAASIMGLFDFAFLFWAPLFAWLIWGEGLSARMAAGMALIVIAGALALWSGERWVARRRTGDGTKQPAAGPAEAG